MSVLCLQINTAEFVCFNFGSTRQLDRSSDNHNTPIMITENDRWRRSSSHALCFKKVRGGPLAPFQPSTPTSHGCLYGQLHILAGNVEGQEHHDVVC